MVLNFPTGIEARGMVSLTFIPIADVVDPAAITATEANAVTAINASLHSMSDGWARSTTQTTGSRRRIGSDTSYQTAGEKTVTIDTARFVYDPQNPESEVSAVYAALVEGNEYVVLERLGGLGENEIAAMDYYDAYFVKVNVKDKLVPGDDGELEFTAHLMSVKPPVRDAQIAAGV